MDIATPTYTGDIKLTQNDEGDYDISYINGQPEMTDFLDTSVLLAIFTEPDTWQNDIATTPEEEYVSTFPEVVERATVSDKTMKDGKEAIEKALSYLLKINAVSGIIVTGEILSVYAIGWTIDITRPDGTDSKYSISWDKGSIVYRREA